MCLVINGDIRPIEESVKQNLPGSSRPFIQPPRSVMLDGSAEQFLSTPRLTRTITALSALPAHQPFQLARAPLTSDKQ
jgi:hypothetical protein